MAAPRQKCHHSTGHSRTNICIQALIAERLNVTKSVLPLTQVAIVGFFSPINTKGKNGYNVTKSVLLLTQAAVEVFFSSSYKYKAQHWSRVSHELHTGVGNIVG